MDDDNNLDIFQMIRGNTEPTKDLVKRKLLVFQHYQVDVKEINSPLQWWEKHGFMFPTIGFFVH
jgi:hypothetical protein